MARRGGAGVLERGRGRSANGSRSIPGAGGPATMAMLRAWLAGKGWEPFAFQERAWAAHAAGRSGMINVPTGAGKTYAAYLGALAEAVDRAEHPGGAPALSIVFITPLRAVSRDIEAALRLPVAELGLDITVESRTGDTSSGVRARQARRLPTVLVTTPESLSLLLTREDARGVLGTLRCAIVDEWHELLSTKRGTQTELALARLRTFAPGLRTWALSATLANLGEAARAAVGAGERPVLIRGRIERPIRVESLIPEDIESFPLAGHMGLAMLGPLLRWLEEGGEGGGTPGPAGAAFGSTLVFCNTRSQAERWYQAMRLSRPDWERGMAIHHGSIDREERERIEAGLKGGDIRLVVCTSSLDLGVDFAPVERVVQIGSPKGVSRLIQRAGRSGHRPGAPCRVLCVPTHAMELVEIAAVRRAIAAGEMEPRPGQRKPLDVLVQHLVTCALGGGFEERELFEEVRTAASFAGLTFEEFSWALGLVREGGKTLRAYPRYRRVAPEAGRYRVPEKQTAHLHRMNIGTITGDSTVQLRYTSGRSLGSIEEHFVTRLRPGERFFFAGRTLEFVRMHDLVALVRPARGGATQTPIWSGTRLPISESLARAVREAMERGSRGVPREAELAAVRPVLELQASLSRVPGADEVLAEVCRDREGTHLFLYPFEGRLVHAGLAPILALRLSRLRRATFTLAVNDYGLELLTPGEFAFEEALTPGLFAMENLARDVAESVNMAELAKSQFREIARVAGLVCQAYPGSRKSGRQLHASSSLIYDVFREFDPENLLLAQARREVQERHFESGRLARTLRRLGEGRFSIVRVARPTPLGLPLLVERIGGRISSETLAERISRIKRQWRMDLKRAGR